MGWDFVLIGHFQGAWLEVLCLREGMVGPQEKWQSVGPS